MKNHLFLGLTFMIVCTTAGLVSCCIKTEKYNFSFDDKKDAMTEDIDNLYLPDFMRGYFQHGTYEQPTRVPNPMYFNEIKISSEKQLVFPELSVLSVYTYNPDSILLIKQDDAQINQLFELIKNASISSDIKSSISERLKNEEQDSELYIVIVTGSAKYAVVSIYSLDDNIYIKINQEDSEELFLTTQSVDLQNSVRELSKNVS